MDRSVLFSRQKTGERNYSAKVVCCNGRFCVTDSDMERDSIEPIVFRNESDAIIAARVYNQNGSRFLSGNLLACTPASPWFGIDILPCESVVSVLTKTWPEVSKHVFRNEAFNSGEMLYAGGKYSVSLQSTVESGNIMLIVRKYRNTFKSDILCCRCFSRTISLSDLCADIEMAEKHGFDFSACILSSLR